MIKRLKSFFQYIESRRLLNFVFMLSFLLKNYYIFLISYIIWAVYLIYKFMKASDKIEKGIYFLVAVFVIIIIVLSMRS